MPRIKRFLLQWTEENKFIASDCFLVKLIAECSLNDPLSSREMKQVFSLGHQTYGSQLFWSLFILFLAQNCDCRYVYGEYKKGKGIVRPKIWATKS